MGEIWKRVPDFPRYEVSNQGRVRSDMNGLLTPSLNSFGYRSLVLRRDGKSYRRSVHRLVLIAFRGVRPGMDCRHLDGDKDNNQLANLVWGTRSENILDQVRHGRHNNARKTHCPQGHEYTADNIYWVGANRNRRQCRICTVEHAQRSHEKRKKRWLENE